MGRIGNQMRVGVTQDSEGKLEPRLDMRGKAYFYDLAEIDLADQRSWVGRVLRRFMPLIGQATLSALVVWFGHDVRTNIPVNCVYPCYSSWR